MSLQLHYSTVACEKEPIRVPGAIQPHGVLIVADQVSLSIRNISTNCSSLFGLDAHDIINKSLVEYVSLEDEERLREHLSQKNLEESFPLSIGIISEHEKTEDVIVYAHRIGRNLVVEFEKFTPENYSSIQKLHVTLQKAFISIQRTVSLQHLLEATANSIRAVTQYDRVMIYRFSEDWHGHVSAESRSQNASSFLNHHFPASDIPAQARAVFLENWLRMIPDVYYEPVSIYPEKNFIDGSDIDLGRSSLRSVSPIHIEYLKNMDVASTITLPLIIDDKLWGLIACHHLTPKIIDSEHRQAAISIAQLASSQLVVKDALENTRLKKHLNGINQAMLTSMRQCDDLISGLTNFAPDLLDIGGAHGAALAVNYDGQWSLVGKTPSMEQIESLVDWLAHKHDIDDIFQTNHLGSLFPPAIQYKDVASGVLALSIPKTTRNFILWFRPEVASTYLWAGEPTKRMQLKDGVWRFHPRFSFSSWVETVTGRAEAWKSVEIEAVRDLRSNILALDLQRSFVKEQQERRKAEIMSEEKDRMVHIVSHDIRNPLSVVSMSLQMLKIENLPEVKRHELIQRSERSIVSITNLVNSILDLAALNAVNLKDIGLIPLKNELIKLFDIFSVLTGVKNISLVFTYPSDDIFIQFDEVRFAQIIGNLVSNAIKYTPYGGSIIIATQVLDGNISIDIEDTGPGIPPKIKDTLFDRFVRGDTSVHGAGLGLNIVKETLEKFSGSIDLIDDGKIGAKFSIILPVFFKKWD